MKSRGSGDFKFPKDLREDKPPESVDSDIEKLTSKLGKLDDEHPRTRPWSQEREDNENETTDVMASLDTMTGGTFLDDGHDVAFDTNFFDELIEQVDQESFKYVLDKIMKSRLNEKERECLVTRHLSKNKKTLKEIAEEEVDVSSKAIFKREEKAEKKIKDFFYAVAKAMSPAEDYDYPKHISLQQMVDFVRDNEDRFFRKTEEL